MATRKPLSSSSFQAKRAATKAAAESAAAASANASGQSSDDVPSSASRRAALRSCGEPSSSAWRRAAWRSCDGWSPSAPAYDAQWSSSARAYDEPWSSAPAYDGRSTSVLAYDEPWSSSSRPDDVRSSCDVQSSCDEWLPASSPRDDVLSSYGQACVVRRSASSRPDDALPFCVGLGAYHSSCSGTQSDIAHFLFHTSDYNARGK
jgi:hypothetical protein